MPFSRNLFLGMATAVCLAGLGLVWWGPEPSPPIPRLPTHPAPLATSAPPVVSASSLRGPWASPPVLLRPPAPPAAFKAEAPPTPPDQTSVRYLGVLTGDDGVKTYLFKYLPSAKALTLTPGVENQGWTLVQVTDQSFALRGPGGMYAVSR